MNSPSSSRFCFSNLVASSLCIALWAFTGCGSSDSNGGDGQPSGGAGGSVSAGSGGTGAGVAGADGGGSGGGGQGGEDLKIPTVTVTDTALVQLGTTEHTRGSVEITGPFRISKYPITVGQFRSFVESSPGAEPPLLAYGHCFSAYPLNCRSTEAYTYSENPDHQSTPVTCATDTQARAFCVHAGGTLATLGEWLYAARGEFVADYAWGNSDPTAGMHPRWDAGCGPLDNSVGQYPAGKSELGVEDALLTPAEFADAQPGSSTHGIGYQVIQGPLGDGVPGGKIGFVTPGGYDLDGEDWSIPAWSFRCVWRD